MINFLKKIIEEKYYKETIANEDAPVLGFLRSLSNNTHDLLEVGSGAGRFTQLLKKDFHNINITCLETNEKLAERTAQMGVKTITKNFLDNGFPNQKFDIVHCAHVVEHMPYPEITNFLDELVRITKINGFIMIRSPLMNFRFYDDIDHVRPYPPNSILNYFNNSQQQKTSDYGIKQEYVWYRKEPLTFHLRGFYTINLMLKLSWIYVRMPFSQATGYILILRRIK